MSELVCLAFKDLDTADHVLNELRAMEKEYILDLEDAAIVVRDHDSKVHAKPSVNLNGAGVRCPCYGLDFAPSLAWKYFATSLRPSRIASSSGVASQRSRTLSGWPWATRYSTAFIFPSAAAKCSAVRRS